jgi:hypothetical protein
MFAESTHKIPDISIIAEQFMHSVFSMWVIFVLLEYLLDKSTTGISFLCNFLFAMTGCHKHPVWGLSCLFTVSEKITNKLIRSWLSWMALVILVLYLALSQG